MTHEEAVDKYHNDTMFHFFIDTLAATMAHGPYNQDETLEAVTMAYAIFQTRYECKKEGYDHE